MAAVPEPFSASDPPARAAVSWSPLRASGSSRRFGYTGDVKESRAKARSPRPPAVGGRILALDYGRTKIGVALADSQVRIAEPLLTLERINRNEDMRRLRELARDEEVRQIVVGLPLRLDGTPGEMAEEATRFAVRIHKQIGLPVELVDERLTSWEAERVLEEELGRRIRTENPHGTRNRSKRIEESRYTVDAVAAMVILREFLSRLEAEEEGA